ncbi:MAG: MFS transporter [Frankia sp.]
MGSAAGYSTGANNSGKITRSCYNRRFAYTLSFGGLLLLGGRAGDIFGRRRVLLTGIALFTVASLAAGAAPNPALLLAARAAQGMGAAFAGPSTLALIASNFAAGPARNRALGAFAAVSGVSLSLGLLAGGLLTATGSWRWVFIVNLPIGAAVLALAPRYLRETSRQPGRLDLAGALTSTMGMVALVYGFIRAAGNGWSDPLAMAAFPLALAAWILFVAAERRAAQPLVPGWLFADRNRVGAYLNMLFLPATMFGALYFLTQFVQEILGFSPLRAGLAFLPMSVSLFATSRLAPRLVTRFGVRPPMIAGAALIIGGTAWLSQISADGGYLSTVAGPLVLIGVGTGLSFFPLNLTILAGVPVGAAGAASGVLQAMQQVGASLGLAVLVTVYTAGGSGRPDAGTAAGRRAVAAAMSDGFAVAALFGACALATAVLVIRGRRSGPHDGLKASTSCPRRAATVGRRGDHER